MPQRSPDTAEKSAAEYGREAVGHWAEAFRLGARALSERKREKGSGGLGNLKQHLPSADQAEGQVGELADAALAKFGKGGRLAAKAHVGRRAVKHFMPEGVLPEGEEEPGNGDAPGSGDGEGSGARAEANEDHLFDDTAPMPIQESIDVAVPVAAVFDLCTRFEELQRFSDRVEAVEVEDDRHFALAVKIGRRERGMAIEITGEEPEERLDWECSEEVEHTGVVSFHPLAPRLTRVELTIEPASESVVERALRLAGLPERAVRQELRRFKAYAELWDEANEYRSADFKDPASEEDVPDEDEADEEEPVDEQEEELDEQDEDQEEDEEEEEEEPLDDEELEPAAKG